MVEVVDRFLDFSLSLDDQKPMCEMVACHTLATWFLDAFNAIGYLWPNGAKGSGKTKLLHVVSEMAYLGEVILAASSVPCLRDWADYGATLCYDEAENLDGNHADPDKLSLLLSGNRRGSTMAVKELVGDKWVTRHVNTYCPRLFSAIRLPGETLESRSIVIPLVRSADKDKANSDALNPLHWPCDRKSLIDNLWSLALGCLAKMPAYEDHVNRESELMGRALEPWRPILAVAKWLDDQGVDGLYSRMVKLFVGYQEERKEIVHDNFTTMVIEALHQVHQVHQVDGGGYFVVSSRTIAEIIMESSETTENPEENRESTVMRVGKVLKQLRFKNEGQPKRGKPREWRVYESSLESAIASHGLLHGSSTANRGPRTIAR
jgi:hypothetical protein